MEQQQEKVYVAVGKDMEEGFSCLEWAMKNWPSPSTCFVILHVFDCFNDFVPTPMGMIPVSTVSEEILEYIKVLEQEKIEKIFAKYTNFCCKVKVEEMKVQKTEGSVYKAIVEQIGKLHICRLMMGISSTISLSWREKFGTIAST